MNFNQNNLKMQPQMQPNPNMNQPQQLYPQMMNPTHMCTCNICKKQPIQGYRYSCITKANIELCDDCFHGKRSMIGAQDDGFRVYYFPNQVDHIVPAKVKNQHNGVKCDGCKKSPVRGKRYQCSTKPNYDLCENCFINRGHYHMFGHNWKEYVSPNFVSRIINEKGTVMIHGGCRCDGCRTMPVTGRRYKCKTRFNYDLCGMCFKKRNTLNMAGHNWVVYSRPGVISENVNENIARHVGVKCDNCKKSPMIGKRYKCQTRNNYDLCGHCFVQRKRLGMANHNWNVYATPGKVEQAFNERIAYVWKGVRCDGCNGNPMVGRRFKCLSRLNYDLCQNCFNARGQQNMAGHNWRVLLQPNKIERVIREKVHRWTSVTCDGCRRKPVVGRRYQCKSRANYDLCANCFCSRQMLGMGGAVWRSPGDKESDVLEKGMDYLKRRPMIKQSVVVPMMQPNVQPNVPMMQPNVPMMQPMKQGPPYVKVDGGLKWVEVGGGKVWGVNKNDDIYTHEGKWKKINGKLKQISVGSDGTVWGINAAGNIYRYQNGWAQIAGNLTQISVGSANCIVGVQTDGNIYQWTGNGWKQLPGSLAHVAINKNGQIVGVNAKNEIWFWKATTWKKLPGSLRFVRINDDGGMWGINKVGQCYHLQNENAKWVQISNKFPKNVLMFHVSGTNMWCVDKSHGIYRKPPHQQQPIMMQPRMVPMQQPMIPMQQQPMMNQMNQPMMNPKM